MREMRQWSEQNKALARSGAIQWSDYYRELFSRLSNMPDMSRKAELMEHANFLLTAAQAYEGGQISKDDFEGLQRMVIIQTQKQTDADRAAGQAEIGKALQKFGNGMYGPAATQQQIVTVPPAPPLPKRIQCQSFGNTTNCVER